MPSFYHHQIYLFVQPDLWCWDPKPNFDFQIKEKLDKVIAKEHEMSEKWDRHWEVLQQCEYTYTVYRHTVLMMLRETGN